MRRQTAICNSGGEFSETRQSESDRPVYKIEIGPEDGLYPMPYMARQADGSAWETDGTSPLASREQSRQPFLPDGSRIFEEIDRFGIGRYGTGNLISNIADIDFYRIAPSGGYMKGLAADKRTDMGRGRHRARKAGNGFLPLPAEPSATVTIARGTRPHYEPDPTYSLERQI